MYVDTHVHLYADAYDDDRDEVVDRARRAGVGALVLPAVDVASIGASLALCDRYDGVWAMAGLHPTYLADAAPDALDRVEQALGDPRVVAVGGDGARLLLEPRPRARAARVARGPRPPRRRARPPAGAPQPRRHRQRRVERRDLVDALRAVRSEPGGDGLRGVFHCFGGPPWLAGEVMGLGFWVGLGGTLTFKNAGVAEAVAGVPLDRIVLETDGPYLAPTPHRGGRNEPAYVPLVAQRLAEARGLPVADVERATTENALRLFGIGR